jgi:hypothetical protein
MSYDRAMDGYGAEDFVIPEIELIQNTGGETAKGEGAKPGEFYCSVTGDIIKEAFYITIIDIVKERTYWGRTDISDDPPVCSSLDGKTSLNGESCDKCPYEARNDTPWLLSTEERRKKCLLHYTIRAIKDSLPVMIRVGGISVQPVRELLTTLRLNRQLKGEYHRALIKVWSVKKKTAAGEAYQMQLRAAEFLTDADKVKELKDLSQQFLGLALPQGAPEEEIVPAGAPAEPAGPAPVAEVVEPPAEQAATPPAPAPEKTEKEAKAAAPQPAAPATKAEEPPPEEPPAELDTDF